MIKITGGIRLYVPGFTLITELRELSFHLIKGSWLLSKVPDFQITKYNDLLYYFSIV